MVGKPRESMSPVRRVEVEVSVRVRSRALLTGTCRSLTRLTRTLWVTFRSLVAEAAADDPQWEPPSPLPDTLDY